MAKQVQSVTKQATKPSKATVTKPAQTPAKVTFTGAAGSWVGSGTPSNTSGVAIPRGAIFNGAMACGTVVTLYSTHRRQYVLVKGGKVQGYFTASQVHGHSNAVNRVVTGTLATFKLHKVTAQTGHLQRLPAGVVH